jgi:hypothetical protein
MPAFSKAGGSNSQAVIVAPKWRMPFKRGAMSEAIWPA